MNKFLLLVLFSTLSLTAFAQNPSTDLPTIQPFGKVEMADMELKACDFEKDANAMILFDVGDIADDLTFTRHVRIKVFNDFGKGAGNFRLGYFTFSGSGGIKNIEAETLNLNNGKVEITPLDKKQLFIENIDRWRSEAVFAMPAVKAGSVIDVKYQSTFGGTWFFQGRIPTRYSEIKIDIPSVVNREFKFIPHVTHPYVKDVGKSTDFNQDKAMAYVKSLPEEPMMGSYNNNRERVDFIALISNYRSWGKLGELLQKIYDMDQLSDLDFAGEKTITDGAKALKTNNEKIQYIYNQVKSNLKWNNVISLFAANTTQSVWNTKTGNSAEINWILFHLLKKAGITCYPLMIGDKENTKINPFLPNAAALSSMVVYIPLDGDDYYVLDATNKYNLYNTIPVNVLNSFGLKMDKHNVVDTQKYQTQFINLDAPVIKAGFFNAEIKPDGKMIGTADLTSKAYNKMDAAEQYDSDGEKKYLDFLSNHDNNVKISGFKIEGMDVDSLPLLQHFDFNIGPAGGDDNYIYFKSNLFNLFGDNPFKSEQRFSDIDFGYRSDYSVSGVYKLPAGYKIDALPPSVTIVMPDESMFFKRIVAENDGTILIKYILDHKKSIYYKTDYQDIRGFYKKMYELLDEQVVLKKAS